MILDLSDEETTALERLLSDTIDARLTPGARYSPAPPCSTKRNSGRNTRRHYSTCSIVSSPALMTERCSTCRRSSQTDRTTRQADASTDTLAGLSPVAASGFDEGRRQPSPANRGSLRGPRGHSPGGKTRAGGGFGVTAIDFRTDPVVARRHRVVSLVTHANIQEIVWADDETGCYAVRGRDAKGNQIVVERSGPIKIDQREEVTMPDRDNAELWERTTLVISGSALHPRANRHLRTRCVRARSSCRPTRRRRIGSRSPCR